LPPFFVLKNFGKCCKTRVTSFKEKKQLFLIVAFPIFILKKLRKTIESAVE
jgi:hypothetical protein